ncbi:TetR/AcrR family transcriptional regulator [Nocardia cyriacigeorgica]|uniref:TetR/AcrR family transcriptional regulator n=1 Tax=Nocardia cyriacigeorgica TaxID=135487 RepID=UPI0018937E25|nr:TetR/AcrR family transcriptional regulator [Nocardia cyriacigeorgica]MBF6424097.1 TetR/AcrR family transcriptional regulator [Nocardia cyriacigeorgica]
MLSIGAPLPGTAEPTERADAARNRQLLLDAAQQLVREHGVDGLTMDAVAKRAGVGKGTVFRRFGNRTGLMLALLDHSERKFQEAFMFGPPPLGPGASAVERLVEFGRARLLDIEVEGELHRAAEMGPPGERYRGLPYNLLKTHVAMLLREAATPGDIPLLADSLLAALSAALVLHQIRAQGYTRGQIGDHWEGLVRRVAGPVPPVE